MHCGAQHLRLLVRAAIAELGEPRVRPSEHWNQDYTGHLHYGRGLDIERREGDRTTSLKAYREAIQHYELAARIDPANMLVQLHRGTLLQLTGAHAEAVALY
jgi:hypothetical protein